MPAGPFPKIAPNKVVVRDTTRLPYAPGKVYEVRLMRGALFALELPPGESARNIWVDNRWWKAESTPGSSRVFLRALGTEDVVGRRGFIHVETEPSDYRISLKVVGVPETADVSPGLAIYVEGSALNDPVRLQARKLVDRELLYIQHREQEKASPMPGALIVGLPLGRLAYRGVDVGLGLLATGGPGFLRPHLPRPIPPLTPPREHVEVAKTPEVFPPRELRPIQVLPPPPSHKRGGQAHAANLHAKHTSGHERGAARNPRLQRSARRRRLRSSFRAT
jgi:hypothetical protein